MKKRSREEKHIYTFKRRFPKEVHYHSLSTRYGILAEDLNRHISIKNDNGPVLCQTIPDTSFQTPNSQSQYIQALKAKVKLLKCKLKKANNALEQSKQTIELMKNITQEYLHHQNARNNDNQQKINDLQLDLDKRVRFANVDPDRMRDRELKLQEDEAAHRHKTELIESLSSHRERQILGFGAVSRVLGDMKAFMLREMPLHPYVSKYRTRS